MPVTNYKNEYQDTPAANNSAPPVGAPPATMLPSQVDDVLRQVMANMRSMYDDLNANKAAPLGFTPVQQGTGIGQAPNTVKVGWSGGFRLKATVDASDLGNFVFDTDLGAALSGYAALSGSPTFAGNVTANAGVLQAGSTAGTSTRIRFDGYMSIGSAGAYDTYRPIARVISSTSAPSGTATEGTLWVRY